MKINFRYIHLMMLLLIIIWLYLFYFQLPFRWDDWPMSNSWEIRLPFEGGDNIPSRHLSRLWMILPPKILAPLFNGVVHDMYISMNIAYGIAQTAAVVLLWFVSAGYLWNKKKILALYILALLSFTLSRLWYEQVSTLEYIGGLATALLVWLPFVSYCKHKRLPDWIRNNPIQSIGLAIPFFYLGSHVTDMNYWMMGSLSFALLTYILFNKKLQTDRKLTIILLLMHIFFCCMAFIRVILFSPQIEWRINNISLDFGVLYHRIFDANRGDFFQDISIVAGIIVAAYYVWKFVKNKSLSIHDYYHFSGIFCSLLIILAAAVAGASLDTILYILWIFELSIILQCYESKNKFIVLILPISLLILVLSVFRIFDWYAKPLLINNYDYKWVAKFKEAQQKKLDEVLISEEDITEYQIPVELDNDAWITRYHFDGISSWMYTYKYTDKIVPIRIIFKSRQ